MAFEQGKLAPQSSDVRISSTEEEAKVIREVLKTSQTKHSADVMDQLLERHDLRRALRVNAWVARFIRNRISPKSNNAYEL